MSISEVTGGLAIKYRDNNSSKFVNEIPIPLAEGGNPEQFRVLRMGQYRSRQYKIVITSLGKTVVVGMDEEIEVCT